MSGTAEALHDRDARVLSEVEERRLRVAEFLMQLVQQVGWAQVSVSSLIEDVDASGDFLATARVTVPLPSGERAFDAEGAWYADERVAELDALEHALAWAVDFVTPPPPVEATPAADEDPLPF